MTQQIWITGALFAVELVVGILMGFVMFVLRDLRKQVSSMGLVSEKVREEIKREVREIRKELQSDLQLFRKETQEADHALQQEIRSIYEMLPQKYVLKEENNRSFDAVGKQLDQVIAEMKELRAGLPARVVQG